MALTRAQLIDAAVRLCLEQGYEQTTVSQIADAVGVSERTFARYFPAKETVLLALVDDLTAAVADEMTRIPPEVPALGALRDAHLAVLGRVRSGGVPGLTVGGIAQLLRVLNAAPELRASALTTRLGISAVIAARTGAPPGHRDHELVAWAWAAITAAASGDHEEHEAATPLGPELFAERLDGAYRLFTGLAAGIAQP